MKHILVNIYKLGLTNTKLENGTKIKNLKVSVGNFPNKCWGKIEAEVNGRVVKYQYVLPCQNCRGCD